MPCRYDNFIVGRLWQVESNRLNAFKTMSMRIRGAKTELEEAGESTEGMAESTASLRQEIMALSGVDIMLDKNTFKSTYQIMDELSNKWEDLSDIAQASIIELVAGKHQGNVFASLMANFDIARDALDTSLNSSGSAMAEHAKWSESLEARLNKLKASWQSLSQTFMSSDFLRVAIDTLIKLVDVLDWAIDRLGAIPTLFLGFASLKGIGKIISTSNGIGGLKSFVDILPMLEEAFPSIANGIKVFKVSISSATGSITGFSKASLLAKGALKGLWTIIKLNPIGATITAVVAAIAVFKKLKEAKEELAKEVEELTSKYKEQHAELVKLKGDYDTSNEDSMISKYERLSKGVKGLNENVSLTSDEYEEYIGITNKIAEQMPSLIIGYDEQGNAILSCKDNVALLVAEYEKLIARQNELILGRDNYEKVEKDFKNAMEEARSNDDGFLKVKAGLDEINALEGLLKSDNLSRDIPKIVEDYGANFQYLIKALEDNGIEMEVGEHSYDFVKRALTENSDIVQRIVDDFNASLDAESEGMRSAAQAALSNAFDFSNSEYSDISDKTQSLIRQIVGSFDAEKFEEIVNSGQTVEQYINNMLDSFKNMSSSDIAKFEAAFDLKTKFNGGDISFGQYVNNLENAGKMIEGITGLDDDIKHQIMLSLDIDKVTKDYEALKTRLTSKEYNIQMNDETAEEFLRGLSASEYSVAVKLIADEKIDFSKFDAESFRKYIEEEAAILDAMTFSPNIEIDKASLETFNTLLEESASAMGLSSESISALESKYAELDDFNPAVLFEKTANGIKVNRDELARLEKEQRELTKSKVKKHLETLVDAYNDTTEAIDKTSNAAERARLLGERDEYASQIRELSEYQAQLEGVTGAYQRWLDAQEGPEDYEGYEGIATGWKTIAEEIKSGFIGNKSKAFIDLLSGKDLEGGPIDDYFNAWKALDDKVTSTGYSIQDFFTLDDDGNITSTGIDRFFASVQKEFDGSIYKLSEDGSKYIYDFSQENLQKIQDEWGIGIEAIGLLLEAAGPAGYDVDWDGLFDDLNLDTSSFETILTYAEAAQKAFNELDGVDDVSFNFKADNIEDATSELEKARTEYKKLIYPEDGDGKIKLNAEGAEEMRVMLSALILQKQQLEDSNIVMNIDTSQLDESQQHIGAAIDAVIDFRNKYKNLEIAVSTGQGIEQAKADLDAAMTELQGLGDDGVEVAAQLVLGAGSSPDAFLLSINDAIKASENGAVQVGCELDSTAIGTLNAQLKENFTPEATVAITGIDDTAIKEYQAVQETAEGKVIWSNDDSLVVEFQETIHEATGKVNWTDNTVNLTKWFTAKGTVTWTSGNNVKVSVVQTSEVDGTANANGTAFANGTTGRAFKQGDWGIKGSGTALVGELGMETLVRGGHFYTIGDNGAEFINYKPGDIIFNHKI